jgi:hypothetical protein
MQSDAVRRWLHNPSHVGKSMGNAPATASTHLRHGSRRTTCLHNTHATHQHVATARPRQRGERGGASRTKKQRRECSAAAALARGRRRNGAAAAVLHVDDEWTHTRMRCPRSQRRCERTKTRVASIVA